MRDQESMFGDERDRELLELAEAAALAGEQPRQFLIGTETGLYPRWNGYPDRSKQYMRTPAGRWKHSPRWRRGDVERAIARRDAGARAFREAR